MKLSKIILSSLLLLLAVGLSAEESNDLVPIPIEFVPTFKHETLMDELKGIDFFADLDEDYEGSPLTLYASFVNKDKSATTAGGFASALITSGTLGIVPMATNNDITIRYQLVLHGDVVATHQYSENFKGVQNIWLSAGKPAITDDMKAWLSSTVEMLKDDYEGSEATQTLVHDYNYFFVSAE